MRRRVVLAGIGAAIIALGLGTGCARKTAQVGLSDVAVLTTQAMLTTLLGPPENRIVTMTAPPDPPLLKKGVYEKTLLASDLDGFVRVSRGSLPRKDLEAVEKEVVGRVDKILKEEGFETIVSIPYPPPAPSVEYVGTLLVTLTPVTEEGGSPQDRSSGKGQTYVLVRLTVSDAATGKALRIRDYYSGRDVGRPTSR